MIYNVGGGATSAENISYDNTQSQLEAENVQDGIDELNSNLMNKADKVTYSTSEVDTGDISANGKHIYRKTFIGINVSIIESNIIQSNVTMTGIIKTYGYILNRNAEIVPIGFSTSGNYFACVFKSGNNLKLDYKWGNTTSFTTPYYEITVEYTKD